MYLSQNKKDFYIFYKYLYKDTSKVKGGGGDLSYLWKTKKNHNHNSLS